MSNQQFTAGKDDDRSSRPRRSSRNPLLDAAVSRPSFGAQGSVPPPLPQIYRPSFNLGGPFVGLSIREMIEEALRIVGEPEDDFHNQDNENGTSPASKRSSPGAP